MLEAVATHLGDTESAPSATPDRSRESAAASAWYDHPRRQGGSCNLCPRSVRADVAEELIQVLDVLKIDTGNTVGIDQGRLGSPFEDV
jgi:hypothetical protein